MSADYGYANARLRAMKSRLLVSDDYHRLLAQESVASFISLLAATDYQEDVEDALLHASGIPCVADALRRNAARIFGRVYGLFGAGEPELLIRILLSRWDLQNVLTLIRGQANRIPRSEILAALAPVGRLDWIELETLAQQPSLTSVVDLMLTRHLPYANSLARAMGRHRGREDLKQVEYALIVDHYRRISEALSQPSANGRVVLALVQAEIDNLNLSVFLRLWSDAGADAWAGAPPTQWLIPGGSLHDTQWQKLFHAESAEQILTALPTADLRTSLAPVLGRGHTTVAQALERNLAHRAIALWYTGDPLGIALAAGYIWAKTSEMANVRLLAYAVAGELDGARIWEALILWPNSS